MIDACALIFAFMRCAMKLCVSGTIILSSSLFARRPLRRLTRRLSYGSHTANIPLLGKFSPDGFLAEDDQHHGMQAIYHPLVGRGPRPECHQPAGKRNLIDCRTMRICTACLQSRTS